MDGFTISNGTSNLGGGIYCYQADPFITNCIILENTAALYGGGLYLNNSSPIITNCTIIGNTASYSSDSNGGGLYLNNSSPIITNSTVIENTASSGGGLYLNNSSPIITNSTVIRNTAYAHDSSDSNGGGLYLRYSSPIITNSTIAENICSAIQYYHAYGGGLCLDSSSPVIKNCSISGNTVSTNSLHSNSCGGGLVLKVSSPVIKNCLIIGNTATTADYYSDAYGGGVFLSYSSQAAFTNCLIIGNTAITATSASNPYGGGLYLNSSSPVVTNCSISGNKATAGSNTNAYGGGLYLNYSSQAIITNCINWDNSPMLIYNSNSTPTITYSDIQGGYGDPSVTHNIDANPSFVNPSESDYHLNPNSPCIDKGRALNAPTDDMDGNERPNPPGGLYDIGAYEYQIVIRCYKDKDGDLYGDPNISIQSSTCQVGYVNLAGDCNDSDPNINPGMTDLCDGKDNDCNPATADGSKETWFGVSCDGQDTDLCLEGVFKCADAIKVCTDTTGNNLDLCNGLDDDCNPATVDGTQEEWIGTACDGQDTDLCKEGVYECTGGKKTCTDTTGHDTEVCDGIDNDCDNLTDEGLGQTTCGLGICRHTINNCADGKPQACDPYEGASAEICNGLDDDCNGVIPSDEFDIDKDGYLGCKDCNDEDPNVYAWGPGIFFLDPNYLEYPNPSIVIAIHGDGFDTSTVVALYDADSNATDTNAPIIFRVTDTNVIDSTLIEIKIPYDLGEGAYNVQIMNQNSCASMLLNALIIDNVCQPLYRGFNMVSLPMAAEDMHRVYFYPDAIGVHYYDRTAKRYIYVKPDDEMQTGIGYWVFNPEENCYPLGDIPITHYFSSDAPNALLLEKGWNLIGALSGLTSISVSNGAIDDIQEYSDGTDWGYKPLSGFDFDLDGNTAIGKVCLSQGKGYWAHATEQCWLSGSIGEPNAANAEGTGDAQNIRARLERTLSNEEVWAGHIKAIGMWKEGCATSATVIIGLYTRQIQVPALPEPPCTTISLDLIDNATFTKQVKDIRVDNSQSQTWALLVENKGDADPSYCPLITWDFPSSLDGHLELKKGKSGTGEALVSDMKSIASYRMRSGDGKEFYVVWTGSQISTNYYYDADSDGFGGDPNSYKALARPEGLYTALVAGDCNDLNKQIYPGAPEICDGIDTNCDKEIDPPSCTQCTYYYRDSDGDGYGATNDFQCLTGPQGEYTTLKDGDLKDTDASVFPRILRIGKVEGYPGQTNRVMSIEIEDALGVAGIDITLSYDPNTIRMKKIVATSLVQGFLSNYSIREWEGRINLVIAGSTGLKINSGVFAAIEFDIAQNVQVGHVMPVHFEKALVYNENADSCGALTSDGEIRIVEEYPLGDLNMDKQINSADAIVILKIAVGLIVPDDYQSVAGNVNKDGLINSADAILVLKAAVEKTTLFCVRPNVGMPGDSIIIKGWNFGTSQGDSVVYFDNTLSQPIIASIITWSNDTIVTEVPDGLQPGDVDVFIKTQWDTSNTVNFIIGQHARARLNNESFRLDKETVSRTIGISSALTASPCEQVVIPIEVNDASGIAGMDIVLGFDDSMITPVKAECTPLTAGFLVIIADRGNGEAMVSLASASGISSGEGALVNLVFEVTSKAQEGDICPLIIKGAGVYDEDAGLMEGIVTLNGELDIHGDGVCPEDNGEDVNSYSLYPSKFNLYYLSTLTKHFIVNQGNQWTFYPFLPYSPYFNLNSDILGLRLYSPFAPSMEYTSNKHQGGRYPNQDWFKDAFMFYLWWNEQGIYYPYVNLFIPWHR